MSCRFLINAYLEVSNVSNKPIVMCFGTQFIPSQWCSVLTIKAMKSCGPSDIQRSKLIMAKTQYAKTGKTYVVFSFQPSLIT
jgi:hypothetical protein